jgi:hypothetical protein
VNTDFNLSLAVRGQSGGDATMANFDDQAAQTQLGRIEKKLNYLTNLVTWTLLLSAAVLGKLWFWN